MKKILTILILFICTSSYSQITMAGHRTASGGCAGAGVVGVTINDLSLTAGTLYILAVWCDSTNNNATLSGLSETFTPLSQLGGFARRLSVYRMMPTSSSSTQDLTIAWTFGNFPAWVDIVIYRVEGVPIGDNGANAVKQVVVDSNTSADPVLTFSGMGNRSAVLSFWDNERNPFNGTAESGWGEGGDSGCATYPGSAYIVGDYIMSRTSTNDNTANVTATSSTWRGVGLLFNPARRLSDIN